MKKSASRNTASIALSDEAIEWLVKLQSGNATDADHRAWQAWRDRSDAHESAAHEAETIWHGIGLAANDYRQRDNNPRFTRRAVVGGGLAIVGAGAIMRSDILFPSLFADHVTNVGEQRNVALEDGSSIFMNANTAISVNYGPTKRQMTLHKGQAKFSVAHDPTRAFVVEANGGHARALGTVFDVDIRASEVVVTTLEGSVEVDTVGNISGSVKADMGHSVRYDDDGKLSLATLVDLDAETAWQRGKLIFNRRPLGDVVLELERYRRGRIVIATSSLRSLDVSGVFDIADPDAVLETLEETLAVNVIRLPFVTIVR